MNKNKMRAKDYTNAIADLEIQLEVLKTRIAMRLLTLAKRYPEAPIETKGSDVIKAKSIDTANAINNLDLEYQILMIERIEQYITDQNPVKQTKINFDIENV